MEGNDNDPAAPPSFWAGPDPHGQAAMLLVESLLHGLIARSVLTVSEAIEIVEAAIDVKKEIAPDLGDTPAALQKSLDLLSAIGGSLRSDLADK